jgi:hypothetical protein
MALHWGSGSMSRLVLFGERVVDSASSCSVGCSWFVCTVMRWTRSGWKYLESSCVLHTSRRANDPGYQINHRQHREIASGTPNLLKPALLVEYNLMCYEYM